MIRALLRLVLVLVVLVAAGAFLLGYWGRNHLQNRPAVVGTTGHVDTGRARDAGAAIGQKTAEAANKAGDVAARAADKAGELLTDGSLTAKIKSKMALDDLVKARSVDVTTKDRVVTLAGTVRSSTEHDRAVQLARETAGVTQVVDRLTVVPQ
jgi:osmotically-inducible protein OsmY